MTTKDKATDLIKKFADINDYNESEILKNAKERSLIAVDEILSVLYEIFESYDLREYWEQVRKELSIIDELPENTFVF